LCHGYSPTVLAHSKQKKRTIPSPTIACFSSFTFKLLGGQLNYSVSQETIERYLAVWNIGCSAWNRRVRLAIDLQLGKLKVTHLSPSFNATLELVEVSARPWVEIKIFSALHDRLRIFAGIAFEALLTGRQRMQAESLDVSFNGFTFELAMFTKTYVNDQALIDPFGNFTIVDVVAKLEMAIIPRYFEGFLVAGYRRYSVSITSEVGRPVETLLLATNHTSAEFQKEVTLNAVVLSTGLIWWAIPNRLQIFLEGMVLPIRLEDTSPLSFFYGANTGIVLHWQKF
jgi:hypothetical protein